MRYYAIVLGCCLVALTYLFWQQGVHLISLTAVLVALAYWWGLALAIFLLGHGLVAMPRALLRDASPPRRLRRIQECAPRIHDRLEDAVVALDDVEALVAELQRRKRNLSSDLQEWVDDLAESSMRQKNIPGHPISHAQAPGVITERGLADLTRRLVRARHRKARFLDAWGRLVEAAQTTQAIVDSAGSKRLDIENTRRSGKRRLRSFTPYTRYLLHYRVIPILRYAVGSFFSLVSICVVWSEMIKLISARRSAISLTVLSLDHSHVRVGLGGQITAAAWLVYLCAAVLTSINQVTVWGNRALVRRNTYGESACWYASQVAKLTVPLTYHYLTFLPTSVYDRTAFYQFLGKLVDLTPLGRWFSRLLPTLILLPVCITLFGLYGRVRRVLGFSTFDDDTDTEVPENGRRSWREGQDLIERELSSSSGHLNLTIPSSRGGISSRIHPTPRSSAAHRSGTRHLGPNTLRRYRDHADDITASTSTTTAAARTLPTTLDGVGQEEAEDGHQGNLFSEFIHRVGNTFDQVDPPRWMPNFKKGFSDNTTGGGGGGSSSNRNNTTTTTINSSRAAKKTSRWTSKLFLPTNDDDETTGGVGDDDQNNNSYFFTRWFQSHVNDHRRDHASNRGGNGSIRL